MALHLEYLYQCLGPTVFRRCMALIGDKNEAYKATLATFTQVMNHEYWLLDSAPSRLLLIISTRESLRILASQGTSNDSLISRLAILAAERDLNQNRTSDLWFPPCAITPGVLATLVYFDQFTKEEAAKELNFSLRKANSALKPFESALGPSKAAEKRSMPPEWILEQYAAGELDEEQTKPLHDKLDRDKAFATRVDVLKKSNADLLAAYPEGPFMGEVYGKALTAPRTMQDYKKFSRYILPALVLITAFLLIVTLAVTFSWIRGTIISELPPAAQQTLRAPAAPPVPDNQPGIPVKLATPPAPPNP